MASTLSASATGLEIVDRARQKKDWTKAQAAWHVGAEVSKSTLDRFWMQKPIKRQNFKAICTAVGVDWEQVIDLPAIEPANIKRGSNFSRVQQSNILEPEDFAQEIFDWFGAVGFTFEGLPRREGNYVEWIIHLPLPWAGRDRVLVHAIIHETSLGDLDSLQRAVAQYKADQGLLITSWRVSLAVSQKLKRSDDEKHLNCLTFDQLIDRSADFSPYFVWLEKEIKKIEKFYVPLNCKKGEFDPITRTVQKLSIDDSVAEDVDRYIDQWLAHPVTEHVSILGEFGTGKTWFTLHYAWKRLQDYQIAKEKGLPRPRLPLVIRLRNYSKSLDVSNLMAGFFFSQHNIKLNHAVFDRLNQMGKLLLIFDGFDEMTNKVDHQKMVENFHELVKVLTPSSKVILTCRTEHFNSAQDAIDNLNQEKIATTGNRATVPPKFETLELIKFDDGQIREVLSRRTNLVTTVDLLMANSQLLDLLRRPVMAEYVLEALPDIEKNQDLDIDMSRVYLYAVRRKMNQDILTGRTFTSLADKLYFLCELAWEMLSNKMTLNYRDFPDKLESLFGQEVVGRKQTDHWKNDMMGQTMLIRNDEGDYSPAHRSLLEFFVAYKFAAELGLRADDFLAVAQDQSGIDESLSPKLYKWSDYWQREVEHRDDNQCVRKLIASLAGFKPESQERLKETFGKSPLTKAILDLLLPALNLKVKYREPNSLIDLIQTTQANEIEYSGGNAATILVGLESNALEYHNLSGTNLAYANLVNAGLKETNLSGANLENCLTTRVFGLPNVIIMTKDNQQFITSHDDNIIRIWDRVSGEELQKLRGHKGNINCLTLSGDGRLLYSGSDDLTIKEWKLDDGICQRTFKGHNRSVRAIVLSGDGQFIYSGSYDGTIKEWKLDDVSRPRNVGSHEGWVIAIALSKDGRFLYSGGDGGIKEWKLDDGICQRTFGDDERVRAIVLNGDGKFLYSGSYDGTIREWKLDDVSLPSNVGSHEGLVRAIVLSENGKFLYSAGKDCLIKEWKLKDGSCSRTFEGHQSWVRSIALSIDGYQIYSCGGDRKIKEWSLDDGSCPRTFDGYEGVLRAIALGDRFLYSGSGDSTIKKWNLDDGSYQRSFKGHDSWVRTICLSPDKQFLYSGSADGIVKKWEISTDVCKHTFEGHDSLVTTIALSSNGQVLYSGSEDHTIKIWDTVTSDYHKTTKDPQTIKAHQSPVRVIILSADEQFLYSGSDDCTIREWKLDDGSHQRTFRDHQGLVSAIALSSDGKFLYSGSDDGTIREWKLDDGSHQRTFECDQGWVRAIALSGDGQFLYSGGSNATIKQWNLKDGSHHHTFEGHQGLVNRILLSTDDKFFYSSSDDGSIKEWDITSSELPRTIDTRLCAGANITNVKGLSDAQTDSLIALGARDDNRK